MRPPGPPVWSPSPRRRADHGPVFITHRKPGPGKVVNSRDICPATGLARLPYGQARMLLDEHTALGGEPGTGWDLMAKSRHKKAENIRKYFHSSPEAIADVTSLLAPG